MASAPLNWLLKIGGDALQTTAQTLSAAVNELKSSISGLAPVATSNDYNDLDNTPSIPAPVDISGKADKVANATNGNFASLDANGNLVDSGKAVFTVLPITDGGTGNSAGYIRTGQASGTTVGANATCEGHNTAASGAYSHAEGCDASVYTVNPNASTTGRTVLQFSTSSQFPSSNTYNTVVPGNSTIPSNATAIKVTVDFNCQNCSPVGGSVVLNASVVNGIVQETVSDSYIMYRQGYTEVRFTATLSYDPNYGGNKVVITAGVGNPRDLYTGTTERLMVYITLSGFDLLTPSTAGGIASHAEGSATSAAGNYSHAEGNVTKAYGAYSHAEGSYTEASGSNSHAEGSYTKASKAYSHAEGEYTEASKTAAHAEGSYTKASGAYSHAEGFYTKASGDSSHAGGIGNRNSSFVEAKRFASFVHGNTNPAYSKFRSTTLSEHGDNYFGFDMSGAEFTADTAVTDGQNGVSGCIENITTVTIDLDIQGLYLLVCSGYTISSGALYGSTVNLITGAALSAGTPTNLAIKASSNAPATIAAVANNKITIKNGAATRAAQFTLIRLL